MAKSKFRGANNPSEAARRNADLERSREKLMEAVMAYKDLLSETILLANRTQPEKKALNDLLADLNKLSLEVDTRNVGEGSRVLSSAALNSILLLHDEINQLKFHNYYLTKRVEELEEKQSEEKEESENDTGEES